jgi:hypothetical protein
MVYYPEFQETLTPMLKSLTSKVECWAVSSTPRIILYFIGYYTSVTIVPWEKHSIYLIIIYYDETQETYNVHSKLNVVRRMIVH